MESFPLQPNGLAVMDGNGRSRHAPAMTVHEFARLVGVLLHDESARAALLQSGQNLTRAQQDQRQGRDMFWETVVQPIFNDARTKMTLNMAGCVDNIFSNTQVDANYALLCKRSGSWLKDRYFSVRCIFTKAYHIWSKSGQKSSEGSDFHKFVPPQSGSLQPSLIGRCCLIMFYGMKCGTPEEDVEVFNFICKLSPGGAGYDDDDDDSERALLSSRGGSARKKKRAFEHLCEDSKRRTADLRSMRDQV